MLRLLVFFMISFSLSSILHAETDEGDNEEEALPLMYYQIDPNILTLYQSTSRKLGYIVVQVQIVVRGQENYDLVELHKPLMQDAFIDFFNRLDKKTVQDLAQRETIRQQASKRVAQVLEEEIGNNIIEDVLFTQYIFQ